MTLICKNSFVVKRSVVNNSFPYFFFLFCSYFFFSYSTDDLQDAAANQGCLGKICGPCKRKKVDDDNEMQPGGKFAAIKKLNCFKKQKKEVRYNQRFLKNFKMYL